MCTMQFFPVPNGGGGRWSDQVVFSSLEKCKKIRSSLTRYDNEEVFCNWSLTQGRPVSINFPIRWKFFFSSISTSVQSLNRYNFVILGKMHPLKFLVVFLLILSVNFDSILTNESSLKSGESPSTEGGKSRTKWISDLMSEGERTFKMDAFVNAKCKRDFELYQLHLRNQSIWALRSKYRNMAQIKNFK